jgi:hypothetical protein
MGMPNLFNKQMPGPATPKTQGQSPGGSGLANPPAIGTPLNQTSQPGQRSPFPLPPIVRKGW